MDEREKSGESREKDTKRWVMEGARERKLSSSMKGRCEDEGEEERDGEMGTLL